MVTATDEPTTAVHHGSRAVDLTQSRKQNAKNGGSFMKAGVAITWRSAFAPFSSWRLCGFA
jgi:hypothetical protein